MITDTKPQNIIVVTTLIIAIVSGVGLISSTSYYSGSCILVMFLDVELEDIHLSHYDPSNESINPRLSMIFNIQAPETANGEVSLNMLMVKIHLNGGSIKYTNFKRTVPLESRTVTSGYNNTFSVGSTIAELLDKEVLYNATDYNEWNFIIDLTLSYTTFDSAIVSFRKLTYSFQGIN